MSSRKRSAIVGIIILLSILLYCWGWVWDPARTVLRYQSSNFSQRVTYSTYEKYLASTKEAVKMARMKAKVNATPQVIFENSPSELLPDSTVCHKNTNHKYDNGILLIHGMFDSPYGMRQFSTFFLKRCFVVEIILLPGHGTIPGDMLNVSYQDWIKTTNFGLDQLASQANNIYISGFSLGGLVGINAGLDRPHFIKALILFNPPIKLENSLTPLIVPLYWLGQIIPRLKWWEYHSDASVVRYESIPLNPIYQITQLINQVEKKLKSQLFNLPVFIVQSETDQTVNSFEVFNLFKLNTNPASRLLWYSSHTEQYRDGRIQVIESVVPTQRILGMSHLSLLLPDTDAIYGIHGNYKDCLHYVEQSENWKQCKLGVNTFLGEVTPENLKNHVMQRLTYNPFYQSMLDQLNLFLLSLGS